MGVAIYIGTGLLVALVTIGLAEKIAAWSGWRSSILRHLCIGLLAVVAVCLFVPMIVPPVIRHFALMDAERQLVGSPSAWKRMNGYLIEEAAVVGKEVVDAFTSGSQTGSLESGSASMLFLTDDEVLERASFFQTILDKSTDRVCAAFLRGNLSDEALSEGFSQLNEDSLRRFARLIAIAKARELANVKARQPTEEELDLAVNALVPLIPVAERGLAIRTLQHESKTGVSDEDLCSMGRRLYASTKKLDKHSAALLALTLTGY